MTDKVTALSLPTRFAVMALLLSGLAACGGGGGSGDGGTVVVSPPPPPATAPIEDAFGLRFGILFRTNANTDPVKPVQSDILQPVDPTRDPLRLRS